MNKIQQMENYANLLSNVSVQFLAESLILARYNHLQMSAYLWALAVEKAVEASHIAAMLNEAKKRGIDVNSLLAEPPKNNDSLNPLHNKD